MVEFSDNVKAAGKELVIRQKLWRDKIGAYMPDAAGPSDERTAFEAALKAFKEALYEANPEFRPPAGVSPAPDTVSRMDARIIHRFLQDIAEKEYGKGYAATNSPRPFNDALDVEALKHSR